MAKIMESPIYLSKNKNIKVKLEEEFYETGEIIVKPLKRKPRTDVPKSKHKS